MKFSVSPTLLSQRINAVARVINAKNALPILENICFTLQGETLTLTGSDCENTLITTLPVHDVEGNGSVCLEAKTLASAFSELKEFDTVTVTVDENAQYHTVVDYGMGRQQVVGQPADEYPRTPSVMTDGEEIRNITIPTADIVKNLNLCLDCVADDELRPQMCGIYFDASEQAGTLHMVASDGHKLMRINCKEVPSCNAAFILSRKASGIFKSIIGKSENVSINITSHNAQIVAEDFTLDCRLIEGRFPNYNSVIPQDNPFIVTVDAKALQAAIRRVLKFGSASSGLIRLDLRDGELKVSAKDLDFNTSAEERIQCEYNATPIAIGFNGQFTLSMLSNFNTNEVILSLADPSRAATIAPKSEDNEDERCEYLGLLMPMMLE